ncbi:receptor-like serine/threonine-protein kinase NCRK [Iris pallida]|uniref:Receptor-like serine/threonine-protein kinase NCRK n=1 Tax=Iris pallida TaxID=29817 RepID=A0AAX6HH09_IRIPA|nr:receptor-like serine/threonine-protein kinase NCRK [Iris pallida]
MVTFATTRLRDSKLVVTKLPDQLLKGNFSKEEIQMMDHLARECLQWDPDSRLTMSPGMSTRKSMPAAFFMSFAPRTSRNLTGIEKPVLSVERPHSRSTCLR